MPWIVTKYKSRHSKPHKMKATFLFTETEIERLAQQPDHCYTIVNTTTRQVSRVGGACKRATPQNLWGAKKESYAAYKRRMKRIAERARRTPGFVPYRAAPYERD